MNPTALSLAARELRSRLAADLGLQESEILIGHPHAGAESAQTGQGRHYVNLFFYRIDHDGFPADGAADEPVHVRMHCLVTAFAKDETLNGGQMISAGENDLRLIGCVMESLHKNPRMMLNNAIDRPVAQVQIVPVNLNADDVNKIWSTQGDTAFRPSVAYEISLAPVPLSVRRESSMRVGATGVGVEPSIAAPPLAAGGMGIPAMPPPVPSVAIDLHNPHWRPHICFWTDQGLTYVLTLSGLVAGAAVRMIGNGDPAGQVDLRWEAWDLVNGWRPIDFPPATTLRVRSWTLDPVVDNRSLSEEIELPGTTTGQFSVYAERTVVRHGADPLVLRSNIVLITIRG